MTIICEFCNSSFMCVSALNYHKKNTKYCLLKQGKIFEKDNKFNCEFCNKILGSKQTLNYHLLSCNDKIIIEKDKEIFLLKQENNKIKEELKIINEKYNKIQTEYELLNNHNEKYKDKLESLLIKAIEKPTTTNNTINNNTLELNTFMKQEDVNYKISSKFNDLYLFEGMKGIAQFVFDHILKDEDGNMIYGCQDLARKKFEYKDKNGNIVVDIEGKKLIKIIQPGLIDQTNRMIYFFTDEYEDIKNDNNDFSLMNEKDIKLYRKNIAIKVGMDIATMHESNKFIKELSKIIK